MKKVFFFMGALFASINISAETSAADSLLHYTLGEVVISSTKETNNIKTLPTAISVVTPSAIEANQIKSLKNLSNFVPNLFIPDYGSRMTSPIYIRGIGSRSSGQAIGMYVDNVPYMDKSTFDFDLNEIQRIEVLRGPQGTLYGRNAMGGIVNVYTKSPLDYQGTTVSIGAGRFGMVRSNVSHYHKFNKNIGIALSGYYNSDEGYFKNQFDGKRVDWQENAGGRARLDWMLSDYLKLTYNASYDFVRQGAFPYGEYVDSTKKAKPVNYNDEGSYERNTFTNSISLNYSDDRFMFNSTSAYQLFKDNMKMDQDYSPMSIFTLNQRQKQNNFNQEFNFKSNTTSNYQWSFGAFGFYNSLNTNAPVNFKEDGIKTILQPVFTNMTASIPGAPSLVILNKESPIPGYFKTPNFGLAIFHQSTYNNLFIDGLSVTAGLRLDYEKTYLNYNTSTGLDIGAFKKLPNGMIIPLDTMSVNASLNGKTDKDFLELLPKFSVKYEFNPSTFIYATAARGYKSGGYNIQMFSDLVQQELMKSGKPGSASTPTTDKDVINTVYYSPEHSWNFEVGTRTTIIPNKLIMDADLFLIDVNDIQLTKFVPSGQGRMIVNAGKARSYGAEVSFTGEITNGLNFFANYGFTHAAFTSYNTNEKVDGEMVNISYKGNHIPFAPQHTLCAGLNYNLNVNKPVLDRIIFSAQYQGAGKIYWNEANTHAQDFYSVVNGKVSFQKGGFDLSLWGKNLTNTDYYSFFFESRGKNYVQLARPISYGADITYRF